MGAPIKPVFIKDRSIGLAVVFLMVIALMLILVNSNSNKLQPLRSFLLNFAQPVYWLADIPNHIFRLNEDWFKSREKLSQENEALRVKVLVLEGHLQKMAQISTQNMRLRNLLKSSLILQDKILVSEIIGVSPTHFNHFVILNKGKDDGVYIGQSVLDADGLLGQVVEVNAGSSRVLLVTDSAHAVPVQVNRSGVRGIVEGRGSSDELDMIQVPLTADVQVGDLLITSGLAGHFPSGYPVAKVKTVDKTQDQFFATIKAEPLADVSRNRFVLLVFSKHNNELDEFNLGQ